MPQDYPPIRFENPIVEYLCERFLKSQDLPQDTPCIVTIFSQDAKPQKSGNVISIIAHAVVIPEDKNGMMDGEKHAHYNLELDITVTLIPCPDSH